MSGAVKSIKKVFKKAVKVVKKVAPVALAAAAVYFTAGAALGHPGAAGGWSGVVKGWISKTGATGILGNVLTSAVTQAGYGAVIGGGIAAVTGEDIGKGALYGAAGGAATGTATGLLQGAGPAVASNPASQSTRVGPSLHGNSKVIQASTGPQIVNASGVSSLQGGSVGDRLSAWAGSEAGSNIIGNVAGGLAKGGFAYAGSLAEAEALEEESRLATLRDQASRDAVSANYSGSGSGLLTAANPNVPVDFSAPSASGVTTPPTQTYTHTMWRYDPEQGRIVKVR